MKAKRINRITRSACASLLGIASTAVLADTDLTGANLTGAHLTGAALDTVWLDEAICDETTRWPDDFTPPEEE